jgi:hypothetical protein
MLRSSRRAMPPGTWQKGRMRLAPCHRKPAFADAVRLAVPRIAIPARLACDVFLPKDRKRHALALELAMHQNPVRFGLPAMAPPGAGTGSRAGEQQGLQLVSVISSDDGQVSPAASNRRIVNRTVEGGSPPRRAFSRIDLPPPSISSHRTRGPSQASPSASWSPSQVRKAGPYWS